MLYDNHRARAFTNLASRAKMETLKFRLLKCYGSILPTESYPYHIIEYFPFILISLLYNNLCLYRIYFYSSILINKNNVYLCNFPLFLCAKAITMFSLRIFLIIACIQSVYLIPKKMPRRDLATFKVLYSNFKLSK